MKYKQEGVFRKDKVKDSQALKQRLLQARGKACERCGYSDVNILTVHHVIRRSDGGTDELSNLELLCPNCPTEIHFYGVKHCKKGLKRITDSGV
jgi:5-methylcytosine-specific restriction endonuclease McrA